MTSSADRILYRKSAQIFEQLGFILPRSSFCLASDTARTSAVVFFNGPFSGYLSLSLDSDLARGLSCNILGDETASDAALQKDTLREIANIICGNALPAIFGFERIFHLEAPRICDGTFPINTNRNFSPAAEAQISFEQGIAEVKLFAESRALTNLPE